VSVAPIGVFDSGVGGLTVVRELVRLLPGESITYFGDTARVPYGGKSPQTVLRYSREAAAFLQDRGVKMLVIACNTATAHAAAALREELSIPVIGVIEPGARAAVRASSTRRIGVVGTEGTIRSGAYDLAVRRLLEDARVYAQPCPLFVPLVEEGLIDHAATRLIAAEYLRPILEVDVDVLILGCTHYPLLRPLLAEVLPPGVALVDSAAETAAEVRLTLGELDLLRTDPAPPTYTFCVSDLPLRFREMGRRFVGEILGSVEHIDIEDYERAA
jgi:glutamate racemase